MMGKAKIKVLDMDVDIISDTNDMSTIRHTLREKNRCTGSCIDSRYLQKHHIKDKLFHLYTGWRRVPMELPTDDGPPLNLPTACELNLQSIFMGNQGLMHNVVNDGLLSYSKAMDNTCDSPPSKRKRTRFDKTAIERMEQTFSEHSYPTRQVKLKLCGELGLSFEQITRWFSSHRRKMKALNGTDKDKNSNYILAGSDCKPTLGYRANSNNAPSPFNNTTTMSCAYQLASSSQFNMPNNNNDYSNNSNNNNNTGNHLLHQQQLQQQQQQRLPPAQQFFGAEPAAGAAQQPQQSHSNTNNTAYLNHPLRPNSQLAAQCNLGGNNNGFGNAINITGSPFQFNGNVGSCGPPHPPTSSSLPQLQHQQQQMTSKNGLLCSMDGTMTTTEQQHQLMQRAAQQYLNAAVVSNQNDLDQHLLTTLSGAAHQQQAQWMPSTFSCDSLPNLVNFNFPVPATSTNDSNNFAPAASAAVGFASPFHQAINSSDQSKARAAICSQVAQQNCGVNMATHAPQWCQNNVDNGGVNNNTNNVHGSSSAMLNLNAVVAAAYVNSVAMSSNFSKIPVSDTNAFLHPLPLVGLINSQQQQNAMSNTNGSSSINHFTTSNSIGSGRSRSNRANHVQPMTQKALKNHEDKHRAIQARDDQQLLADRPMIRTDEFALEPGKRRSIESWVTETARHQPARFRFNEDDHDSPSPTNAQEATEMYFAFNDRSAIATPSPPPPQARPSRLSSANGSVSNSRSDVNRTPTVVQQQSDRESSSCANAGTSGGVLSMNAQSPAALQQQIRNRMMLGLGGPTSIDHLATLPSDSQQVIKELLELTAASTTIPTLHHHQTQPNLDLSKFVSIAPALASTSSQQHPLVSPATLAFVTSAAAMGHNINSSGDQQFCPSVVDKLRVAETGAAMQSQLQLNNGGDHSFVFPTITPARSTDRINLGTLVPNSSMLTNYTGLSPKSSAELSNLQTGSANANGKLFDNSVDMSSANNDTTGSGIMFELGGSGLMTPQLAAV